MLVILIYVEYFKFSSYILDFSLLLYNLHYILILIININFGNTKHSVVV